MPITSRAKQEPTLNWFGINLHVNIGGTVWSDCFHLYFMHTITQQQKKKASFASKTAFRCIEAMYLYSPDTLWMLTWSECVWRSHQNIKWIGMFIYQESWNKFVYWLLVRHLNVFNLFTQRCTLYFSWRNRKSDWVTYACMQHYFVYLFFFFFKLNW